MKKSVETSVHVKETYELTENVLYVKEYVDGVEVKRYLYTEMKCPDGYQVRPELYTPEMMERLKVVNRFYGDYRYRYGNSEFTDYFVNQELPEPEDVKVEQILLCGWGTHKMYTLDMTPVQMPIAFGGSYPYMFSSRRYDVEELRNELIGHPSVLSCSKIKYEAYQDDGSDCFAIMVVPPMDILLAERNGEIDGSYAFDKAMGEYLGIPLKKAIYDEDGDENEDNEW